MQRTPIMGEIASLVNIPPLWGGIRFFVAAIPAPCPLCQQNAEMYQDMINKQYGDKFNIPVVFYSQLMAVAFGMDGKKHAALDCNMIRPDKLIDKVK